MTDLETPKRGSGHLSFDPTADEVGVFAWPLILRARVSGRMERSERYPWLVLVAALSGLMITNYTFTILSVSLSTIATNVHTSTSVATWAITGGMLATTITGPAFGKAGDLYGHRRLYLWGMLGSAVFSGLTAVSWNAGSLIAFRVLASASGSAVFPAASATIARVFGRDERVKAMAYLQVVGAGSPVVGLIIGGYVVDSFSWRWLFIVQSPLCIAAMVVAAIALPANIRGEKSSFDIAGAFWLGTAVSSLLFAINRGSSWGWTSVGVMTFFALSPVCLAMFVRVELRSPDPLFPMEYLRRRNVVVPLAVQFTGHFAYMGGFILTPLLLKTLFSYSNSQVSNLSISRPLAMAAFAPLAGIWALKVGERNVAMVGGAALTVAMVLFSMATHAHTVWWVLIAMTLSGAAMGALGPSLAATVANAVDDSDMGVAGATQNLVSQCGVVIGIQLMTSIHTSQEATGGAAGSYRISFMIAAVMAGLALVASSRVRSTSVTR